MDEILSKAGSQAVTFAIRSGVSLASTYAIKTITNFIIQIPKSDARNIERLKLKLEDRIDIVSSAIDLIKLVAARGNTNLESTLKLTRNLKIEIDQFEESIRTLLDDIESSTNQKKQNEAVKSVEAYITDLLKRIEEITPFINLSLTTSGATLSSTLPNNVSPGLLLQASNFINRNNDALKNQKLQIGPTFQVTLYSIFYNISSDNHINWKEDMKRAFVRIQRLPENKESKYNYILEIEQSFNDERYHNVEDNEEVLKKISFYPNQITKLFFSVSGKLLKLAEQDSGVLVLKVNEKTDTDKLEVEGSFSPVTWYAFGEYEETITSESEDDQSESGDEEESNYTSSIALLEYLIRLVSLQQNDQCNILEINDERLSVYLNDENPQSIKEHEAKVTKLSQKLGEMQLK